MSESVAGVEVSQDVLARLRDAAGEQAVSAAHLSVTPGDHDAAVAAVRVLAETATPFAVRSRRQPNGLGAPEGGVQLTLERLDGVAVHAGALIASAAAGAPVSTLQARVAAAGLAITGFGNVAASGSAGALVARGAVPRRSLTGLEAVLANGDVIVFGGVLKDVVGYDVPSTLLGSMGRLAVILAVTFRLEPAAARTVSPVAAPGPVPVDASLARAFDPFGLLRTPR